MEKCPDSETAPPERTGRWYSRGYHPHYQGGSATQHVTVHLADSLPDTAIRNIELSLDYLPESRRKIARRRKLESLIDASYGFCLLKLPPLACMVQETLLYFHEERYKLYAWVVMPNHFHALFQPINGWSMSKIVASWKKYTARRIRDHFKNADREICVPGGIKGLDIGGKFRDSSQMNRLSVNMLVNGPVWHHEFWDRYIRDEMHFWDTVDYIHNNPVKAGLVSFPGEWEWSSFDLSNNRC